MPVKDIARELSNVSASARLLRCGDEHRIAQWTHVAPWGTFSCRHHRCFKAECCCCWPDFLKIAEDLYTILDSKSTDQVDAVVVNAVVQQLRDAVNRSTDGPAAYVDP